MIISHKHKFVFMHNPKVAGSAIRKVLEHLHDDDMNYWHQGFVPELDRVVDLAHLTWREIIALRPEVEEYDVMVVVRNPYDRFVSAVQECVRQHSLYFKNIDDWVEEHTDETNFRWNWKYIHMCPQHYFVPTTGKTWMLKHEALGEEWASFQAQMVEKNVAIADLPQGVRVRPDVPGTLRSKDLSDFATSIINTVYHQDFRMLGYQKREVPGTGYVFEHHERVNGIHSPYLPTPDYSTLNAGEQIAWQQQNSELMWKS